MLASGCPEGHTASTTQPAAARAMARRAVGNQRDAVAIRTVGFITVRASRPRHPLPGIWSSQLPTLSNCCYDVLPPYLRAFRFRSWSGDRASLAIRGREEEKRVNYLAPIRLISILPSRETQKTMRGDRIVDSNRCGMHRSNCSSGRPAVSTFRAWPARAPTDASQSRPDESPEECRPPAEPKRWYRPTEVLGESQ